MPEKVIFQTKDQVAIVGGYEGVPASTVAVLLLHMMPADRHSWEKLQSALSLRGISSLAIDLRGHGESTIQNGFRIDYRKFSDDEHRATIEDVRAALRWLTLHHISIKRMALVGASIGANLALQTAAENPEIPAVAVLSPGESYRGIATFGAAKMLTPNQSLWATSSQGDDQDSFDATKQIVELAACKEKIFKPLTASGHGTNVFLQHPELIEQLADWLEAQLKK